MKGIMHVPFGHEEKHCSPETHKLFSEHCTSERAVHLGCKGEREHRVKERTLGPQLSMDVKKTKKPSELQRWGLSCGGGKVFQKGKPSAWAEPRGEGIAPREHCWSPIQEYSCSQMRSSDTRAQLEFRPVTDQ